MKDQSEKDNFNIAMIGHKHVPSREGGVEIVVEELSTRMVGLGYNVCCFNRKCHHVCGKKYDSNNYYKEYKGIKLKSVFTVNIKGLAAVSSSFVAAIGSVMGKYDIVHFHAEGPCAMMWLPKLFGKHCIATIHGLDWQREKWQGNFGAKFIKLGEKVAVKYADEIIVLSKNTKKYFKEEYGVETSYIPNGVNIPEKKSNAKIIFDEFRLEKDSYILYLGRLVPEKGLRYLIEAFKGTNTNKKLVIAGGTSDSSDFLKEIKELCKYDERIIFTGFVSGNKLNELYSNAYIYVLPSDVEGMPLSLLEAMAYENCILVSNIEECTEVVEDKALIFEKGNVEDLKIKLQYLCDNPHIVNIYRRNTKEFVRNKYNWDKIVDATLQLYNKVKNV